MNLFRAISGKTKKADSNKAQQERDDAKARAQKEKENILQCEQSIALVRRETEQCTQQSKEIWEVLQKHTEQSRKIKDENVLMPGEYGETHQQVVSLQREAEIFRERILVTRRETERLKSELAQETQATNALMQSTNASAQTAYQDTVSGKQGEEEQQQRWQRTQGQHRDLLHQLEIGLQQQMEAAAERNQARERLACIRNEYSDLQDSHQKKLQECHQEEVLLVEKRDARAKLEQEIEDLTVRLTDSKTKLEEVRRTNDVDGGALATASYGLEKKKEVLCTEFCNFTNSLKRECDILSASQGLTPMKPVPPNGEFNWNSKGKGLLPEEFGFLSSQMMKHAEKAHRDLRLRAAVELIELNEDADANERHLKQAHLAQVHR